MYMCLSLLHIRVQTECRRREEKKGKGQEGGWDRGRGDKEKIRRRFQGQEGKRGVEKRSEEEENTWIYLKTWLYTRLRPIQKEGT